MQPKRNYRSVPDQPAQTKGEDCPARSGVLATETPTPMYKMGTRLVPEVLLMDGMRMPEGKRIPMMDSHDTTSVKNIKGSWTNLRIEDGQLVGDADVSESEPKIKKKLEEGHINANSVGYDVYQTDYVEKDKSRTFNGRVFRGPVFVTSDWEPTETSLTAKPADKLAKMREAIIDNVNSTDVVEQPVEPIRSTMEENKTVEVKAEAKVENKVEAKREVESQAPPAVDEKAIAERAIKEYQEFVSQVRSEAAGVGLSDQAEEICQKANRSLTEARREIIERAAVKQKASAPAHIVVGDDDSTKVRNACKDMFFHKAVELLDLPDLGMEMSKTPTPAAIRNSRMREVQHLMPKGELDPKFNRWGIVEAARFILESQGRDVRYSKANDILDEAMGGKAYHDYSTGWQRDAGPINSINQLQNIFADVQQKVLTLSYQISPVTYDLWCRRLQDAESMNDIHVMQLSGLSMLDVWVDGAKDHPLERKMTDAQERIKVVYYGNNISISRQAMLTNQLDFISRIPQACANAARQRFNNAAYSVINTNQTCGDSNALMSTAHNNLVTAGAYGGATVNSVQALNSTLRKQTGLDGGRIGLKGRFLIGPTVQEVAIGQICRSQYAPTQNLFEAWNPYSGYIPVTDPELDTLSNIYHYLTPEPIYAAVAYAYLDKTPTPIILNYERQDDGSLLFRVEQGGAVGVADFRGIAGYLGS